MLNKTQVMMLTPGFHSNIDLYGHNSMGRDENHKPVPIFLNRKQRRIQRFSYRLKLTMPPYSKRGKLIRPVRYFEVDPEKVRSAVAEGRKKEDMKDTSGKLKREYKVALLKTPN